MNGKITAADGPRADQIISQHSRQARQDHINDQANTNLILFKHEEHKSQAHKGSGFLTRFHPLKWKQKRKKRVDLHSRPRF